jgi:hypothetical protein
MNDSEIERLILSGEAILAQDWIDGDSKRRIGESIFHDSYSQDLIQNLKNRGIEVWLHDFRMDENRLMYAAAVIRRLPKSKARRKNILKGINMAQVFAGLPMIDFVDQKYIYQKMLSAEKVKEGISAMKSNWGGFGGTDQK